MSESNGPLIWKLLNSIFIFMIEDKLNDGGKISNFSYVRLGDGGRKIIYFKISYYKI